MLNYLPEHYRKPHQTFTCVYGANDIQWLGEEIDRGIDLDWEAHLAACQDDHHDNCGPEGYGEVLLGSWKKDPDGKYEPDRQGKAGYAAIYNGDPHYTVQVVWSARRVRRGWASPCYPNQAEWNTPGQVRCYALPRDLTGEDGEG